MPGLSEDDARARLAARGERAPPASSRSTASIVRANVLTPFNVILLALGAVTLVFGDWRDALFLGIVVSNAGIGIVQELRAKRKLDELAALVAPAATVVRGGEAKRVPVDDVVEGDLVRVGAGDQVVADGPLVRADGMLLDESILTGESRPVPRGAGDEVRSGSFVVEGSGEFHVAAVGEDSYAERIAGEAREFRHPRSPLERAVDRLLYVLTGAMVPLGAMLVVALAQQDVGLSQAVDTAVAGMVTLVPEGLVLLVSVTYAAAALGLARRGALAQQINAVESLASVDTLCIDKTGTLTEPRLRLLTLYPAAGIPEEELAHALGRYAAAAPDRNATVDALVTALPGSPEPTDETVPFSSRRRWSGLRIGGTRYVLGAPELFSLGELGTEADAQQSSGRRVLAFGTTTARFPEGADGSPPPIAPLGIAVLAEELRPHAAETVGFLVDEGVEIKVLSGDAPSTVGSIATDAGVPLLVAPLDGRRLPEQDDELVDIALEASVIGRISPDGKRRVVEALRQEGRYVAMVGDGVNDVPALKAARLAISQGSGAQMARAVADVVLVEGDFAAVPGMVAEGRKILRNLQRVTKLFVAKSVFAAFLILSIGLTPTEYPLLPRHLTLAAALAVGIPAFFLALAPSDGPWRPRGFLREVGRFAVPAGVAAGLGVLASYLVTLNVFDLGLGEARTGATTTLVAVGLYLVLALEATGGKRTQWVALLCGVLFALYLVVLALPAMRDFFELVVPDGATLLMAAVGAGLSIGFLWLTDDRFVPGRQGV
jgi:cation-transporting P-type ATPase E